MGTVMIFHEVDDVDHWLTSPKREEVFGPLGITIRTFVDPDTPNRVGLLAEIPIWMPIERSWHPTRRLTQ